MKKVLFFALICAVGLSTFAQKNTNSLLWRISGENLSKPSYLFGTIHLICGDDIQLSDSVIAAMKNTDEVYLELDLDNMVEMIGALNKMKMRNDTTLADLLTKEEYEKVKKYFSEKNPMIPFAMLEKYKPMLAASTLMQSSLKCSNAVAIEQLVMKEAKTQGKTIQGLESMEFQMSIFDSIPYKSQAKQLYDYVNNDGKDVKGEKEFAELTDAYRNQQLNKLEELTNKQEGFESFAEILLYNRNKNWVDKLQKLFDTQSLLIAVGAGHLPGEKGVINLLRKAGYKVEPVENKMIKVLTKEI